MLKDPKFQSLLFSGIPQQSNQFWYERTSNTGKDENSKDNLEESLRRLQISQSSNNYSQQDIIRHPLRLSQVPIPPKQNQQPWLGEITSPLGRQELRPKLSIAPQLASQQGVNRRASGPSQLPTAAKQNQQPWLEENTGPLVHSIPEKPKENFQLPDKFVLKDNEISFYTLQSWPEILSTYEGVDFKGDPIRKIEMYSLPKVSAKYFN